MRVTKYFNLGRHQGEVDFVDVDTHEDIKLFVDPKALRLLQTEWGDHCTHLIQHFFQTILDLMRNNNHTEAKILLSHLREPNETHLGLSKAQSRGRGLGKNSARYVWESLKTSEAVRTGLLEDLEDTILMIEGIGPDIVSDIIINIIRSQLIEYTNHICNEYNIPLIHNVRSGPLWETSICNWNEKYVDLPMADHKRIILVPKSIVRIKMSYDYKDYYNNYILEELCSNELIANSELVKLLKNGKSIVTKKSLKEKYGTSKKIGIQETLKNPTILDNFRKDTREKPWPALTHDQFSLLENEPFINFNNTLNEVLQIPTGRDGATAYENAIEKLLSSCMYPSLAYSKKQVEIHNGRKRIDITYTNIAQEGFFHWLLSNYSAPHVFIECKNYGKEIGNPELDQLSGRFSRSRGQFGFLCCRSFQNKQLFNQRCIDTARDGRGYIIPFDDSDLCTLVAILKNKNDEELFNFYKDKFDLLIM